MKGMRPTGSRQASRTPSVTATAPCTSTTWRTAGPGGCSRSRRGRTTTGWPFVISSPNSATCKRSASRGSERSSGSPRMPRRTRSSCGTTRRPMRTSTRGGRSAVCTRSGSSDCPCWPNCPGSPGWPSRKRTSRTTRECTSAMGPARSLSRPGSRPARTTRKWR